MINVYADGGVMNNGKPNSYCGWGCVIVYPDGRSERGSDACMPGTNNIAELMGAIHALDHLKLTQPKGALITVTSDSQYLVNGASEWMYTWQKKKWLKKGQPMPNHELWQRIWDHVSHFDIEWVWVKGHNGHEMNELCDRLATEAMAFFAGENGL